ncbi:DUF2510 domain-containing protein [Streptomyces albulus]|nr:DUF2510 domain-containing protein [Streptomyces noursei]
MSAPTSGSAGGSPTPGFYPDPSIPGYIRYWNGAAWAPGTSRPAPAEGEPMPAPPPGVAPATPRRPPSRRPARSSWTERTRPVPACRPSVPAARWRCPARVGTIRRGCTAPARRPRPPGRPTPPGRPVSARTAGSPGARPARPRGHPGRRCGLGRVAAAAPRRPTGPPPTRPAPRARLRRTPRPTGR